MRDERRKKERSKRDQTNNKAKQHNTPKAVTFPEENELPRVGLEPMTLYTTRMYTYIIYTSTCIFHRVNFPRDVPSSCNLKNIRSIYNVLF